MDDLELAAALGDALPPDAADSGASESPEREPATDLDSLIDALSGEPLADDATPDDEVAAASADSDEDDEPEEDELTRLRREVEEIRAEKREAEAAADEERARAHWDRRQQEVDARLYQAMQWLEQESQNQYDPRGWILSQLPHIAQGYQRELGQLNAEREQAWQSIARQHGTRNYLRDLAEQHDLSEAEVTRLSKYPPEVMAQVAADMAEIRGSIAQELSTTKGQLTKARNATKRAQLAQSAQLAPGSGQGRITDLATARDRITEENAEALTLPILRAYGMA